jgi:hypothetical protein
VFSEAHLRRILKTYASRDLGFCGLPRRCSRSAIDSNFEIQGFDKGQRNTPVSTSTMPPRFMLACGSGWATKRKPQPHPGLRPLVHRISSQLDLIGGHQFDAAVLGAALSRVVGGDEVGLTVSVRN